MPRPGAGSTCPPVCPHRAPHRPQRHAARPGTRHCQWPRCGPPGRSRTGQGGALAGNSSLPGG